MTSRQSSTIALHRRGAPLLLLVSALAGCASRSGRSADAARPATSSALSAALPAPPPPRWLGLIGEYGEGAKLRIVGEYDGRLRVVDTLARAAALSLAEGAPDDFTVESTHESVRFVRDADGRARELVVGTTRYPRRAVEPEAGTNQLKVVPVRSVEAIRAEALAATPPSEPGPFVASDLVELVTLDPSIKLEIRYATTNNFLGTRVYDEARAFLQRPAAEAVVRAHHALRALGYGLLTHDAYRPWYVTKIFWDAVPPDTRWLVADPAQGSRHNRGAAVDLTLYDLGTGRAVEMPSTYDESTDRAFADYPGGTTRQRWLRAVLRDAMVAQGFRVNPREWWHFDHSTWRSYAIGNVPFDRISRR